MKSYQFMLNASDVFWSAMYYGATLVIAVLVVLLCVAIIFATRMIFVAWRNVEINEANDKDQRARRAVVVSSE